MSLYPLIVHISGANHFLADTLSRNPVGMSKERLDLVREPKEVLVAKIDLHAGTSLEKELKNLFKHQENDPPLARLRAETLKDPTKWQDRYMMRNEVLYCKNDRTHPYWRPILPKDLKSTE
jgi:hypothetical protein